MALPPHRRPEEKRVEVRPDRTDLPPTVGPSHLDGILFGPMAGQPSRSGAEPAPRRSSLGFWILAALVVFCLWFFRNTDPSAQGPMPQPQPTNGLPR